jgi:hypothetical protein
MPSRKFKRKIEDFNCLNCGLKVKGDGYTNHCPICLWSRHMDINPGDRANTCQGMMEPIGVIKKGEVYYLTHRCQLCKKTANIKVQPNDNFELVLKISQSMV